MSNTKKIFNIFLLKKEYTKDINQEDFDFNSFFNKNENENTEYKRCNNSNNNEKIFVYVKYKQSSTFPWWVEYLDLNSNDKIDTESIRAIVFIKVEDKVEVRIFAITFGFAYHDLDKEKYESDFGKNIILRCVDPEKIKYMKTVSLINKNKQTKDFIYSANLQKFGIDSSNIDLVLEIKGITTEECRKNIESKNLSGKDSLKISSSKKLNKLPDLCSKILEYYKKKQEHFLELDNLKIIKNEKEIKKFNTKLLKDFKSQLSNKKEEQNEISIIEPKFVYEDDYEKMYFCVKNKKNDKIDILDSDNIFNSFLEYFKKTNCFSSNDQDKTPVNGAKLK